MLQRDLAGIGRTAKHARVQAGDLDRADLFPVGGLPGVESVREIEDLDLDLLGAQSCHVAAPIPEAPPVTTAFTGR